MTYETDCECGAVVVVKATDAGLRVPCRCGRQVEVPPLSKLRALDLPARRPLPPPAEYGHLRIPGVIVVIAANVVAFFAPLFLHDDPLGAAVFLLVCGLAQMVGIVLVGVSKRFPAWLCAILAPFGCVGLLVAMLLPERLPPTDPPIDRCD
jgi:hypothetical protein